MLRTQDIEASPAAQRPTGFLRPFHLRDAFRAGDVWLARSRRDDDIRKTLLSTPVEVPDDLLAEVSPLGWEHIDLTGEYRWPGADPSGHPKRLTQHFAPSRKRPDQAPGGPSEERRRARGGRNRRARSPRSRGATRRVV